MRGEVVDFGRQWPRSGKDQRLGAAPNQDARCRRQALGGVRSDGKQRAVALRFQPLLELLHDAGKQRIGQRLGDDPDQPGAS